MTERYQNGKIYKLVSDVSDDVYYGSTCMPLAKRLYEHKKAYRQYKKGRGNYVTSFKILEWGLDNCDIVLVEEYPCDNKMQLLKRERHYIENLNCVNKCVPARSKGESKQIWRQANKEKVSLSGQKYYEDNKQSIKENQKKYYETNKNDVKLAHKRYYDANKAKLNATRRQLVSCACGSRGIRKDALSRHRLSKKHKDFELELLCLKSIGEACFTSILHTTEQVRNILARRNI